MRLRRTLALALALTACGPTEPELAPVAGTPPDGPSTTGPGDPTPSMARTRHIVLFTLDTLRADHLHCYGYPRPTSPRLDELARGATLYRRAHTTAPWTLPSHASLFTGLYPFEHGAHSFLRESEKREEGTYNNVRPLSLEHVTLAEVLREHGFTTGAVVSNRAYLGDKYRLDQGFDEYDLQKGTVRSVTKRVKAWLDRHQDDPFFLFVNTMDTHRPYNTAPREGLFDHEVPRTSADNVLTLYDVVMGQGQEPPADLVQELHDQYDLGIYNLDAGVGEILDHMKDLDLFEDALILVTSDHGEYFGEHQLVEHSKDVYEEALHVPLIVKTPGQVEGREEDRRISLVHLPGLILQAAEGVPEEASAPLSGHGWPTPVVIAENYYARWKDMKAPWGDRFRRVRTVVYQDAFKYIRSSDGQNELYHLESDPGEQVNLLEREPALADGLEKRLDAVLANRMSDVEADQSEVLLSADELKLLEALGYN